MSVDSLPPPGRRKRKTRKPQSRHRPPLACACHAPLPRGPRGLLSVEIAWAQRVTRGAPPDTWPPLGAEDLTPDARGRLLERAEMRARRVKLADRHVSRDLFWIRAELALVLSRVHPKVVTRWRDRLRWSVYHAERDLEKLRQLYAAVLAHEPETDAWLRRQLAALDPKAST